MPHQQPPQASPQDGFSIARKVMDDVVVRFLANGGPTVARIELNKIAEVLFKVYADGWEAYEAALEKIRQAEMAIKQAEECSREELKDLLHQLKSVTAAAQQDTPSSPNAERQNGTETDDVELPSELASPKAMLMWQRLQQEHMMDSRYQPVGLSRTDLALLAEAMNKRLGDENDNLLGIMEWKPYEKLWGKKNMKSDLQRALSQDKTPEFRKRIEKLFEGI